MSTLFAIWALSGIAAYAMLWRDPYMIRTPLWLKIGVIACLYGVGTVFGVLFFLGVLLGHGA